MGKSKAKKEKPAADPQTIHSPVSHPLCTCGHSHDLPRAADGHNVEGWTNDDIRIYNDLLTERAKLEKEKNELEVKSARHQAERALLNEDAAAFDNLFKVQLSGEYKFTGTSACCLDFSSDPIISKTKCHHEICSRAKSQGISWMELDTIKYYQTRITSERSMRMKSALQKQRDVELERVKKDDDEELALRSRRSAMLDKATAKNLGLTAQEDRPKSTANSTWPVVNPKASTSAQKSRAVADALQENETVIRNLNVQMDKIRRDFQTGTVSASDATSRLEEVNKQMDKLNKQSDRFREMILGTASSQDFPYANSTLSRALSATSSKDAFSEALSVMKNFLSASDQRGVQAAISDLRNILHIANPMASAQYKNLRSLDELNALPNAKGFSRKLVNHANQVWICSNIEQVFIHLRQAEDLPVLQAATRELKIDESLAAANEAAIEVERRAFDEMIREAKKLTEMQAAPRNIYEIFQRIKERAVRDSLLPPMTQLSMSIHIDWVLPTQLGLALWRKGRADRAAGIPVDENVLAAQLITAFMVYSQKKPEKYPRHFQRIESVFERHRAKDPELCTILYRVAEDVKTKVGAFAGKSKQSQQTQDQATQANNVEQQNLREQKTQEKKIHKEEPQEEKTEKQRHPTGNSTRTHQPEVVSKPAKFASIPESESPALTSNSVEGMPTVQSILNALRQGGSPHLKHTFDYLGHGNKTLSPAIMQHLQKGLEAIIQQPAENMNLSPQAQEQMAILVNQCLSPFGKQVSPPNKPQSATGNTTKDTTTTAATRSKFQEDLSAAPATRDSQIATSTTASPPAMFNDGVSSEQPAATTPKARDPPSGPGDNNTSSPPPYIANEGRARSAVKVKHVAVSTPQISGSVPSPVKVKSADSPATTAPLPAPQPAPDATARQSAIRNQLMAMRGNLYQLKTRAEPPAVLNKDGLGLKDPFQGIVGKIEEQYLGHVAMAKEIASANEWNRLFKWLGKQT